MVRKKNKNAKKNANQVDGVCNHIHTHTLINSGSNVCSSCSLVFYNGGEVRKIESSEVAEQNIRILQTYFDEIKKMGDKLNVKTFYKDFYLEMRSFQDNLNSLKDKFKKAQEIGAFAEFSEIKSDCFMLKAKFDSSQLIAVVARLKLQTQLMYKLDDGFDPESEEDIRPQEMINKAKDSLLKKHEEELKKVKIQSKIDAELA